MEKAYVAKQIEAKWAKFWEEGRFFVADPKSKRPPYSIVMPPPNVTGVLHMGHALVNTLIDILIRWKRMSGFEVLWVPGTDHAGIATQTVVERHLIKSEKKRRSEYEREQFLEHVWDWKAKSEKVILSQLKALGCSCDWSRLRFTMDEGCNQAVRTIFKKLYDEGLIYQGDYLVNWDPVTQTALADDEVEHELRDSFLWTFKYHLADGSGFVYIATTRPETMLGDAAIAVNPKDERYHHLLNKMVKLPFVDREIPIIADSYVDPEFGTGMVKITPAHDPNDYKMGINHKLEMINIMTPDGRINENGGSFEGLSREDAREAVVEQMKGRGLLEKVERYSLRVGVSYRSKAVIEPMLSKQWFVSMSTFAPKLKSAVVQERVKLLPQSWQNTYFHWIDNLRDWCISRQLWWGHRIPVWHHKQSGEKICWDGEGEPDEVKANPQMWEQDPDVLDTWFSSALWPFSTLGWPEKSDDLKKFYPNSVLVTGHDILFFWVARMVVMGEYALDEAPFAETFLHGLIYGRSYWREQEGGGISYVTEEERKSYDLGKTPPKDVISKWEKLSKSKGNVIDPLELIEEYGTDALRMTLCSIANQSPQIDLDRRRFEEFKNFTNKVWNGARFVFMNLEDLSSAQLCEGIDLSALKLEDRWILSAMGRLNKKVNEALEHYHFDDAAQLSYDFFWKEFCAYYVEISKPVLDSEKKKILTVVLCNMIRLLHPMAPFITEELFAALKKHFPNLSEGADRYTTVTIEALNAPACAVAPYPTVIAEDDISDEIEKEFMFAQKVVYTIRNIRGEMKIPPHVVTDIYLIGKFEHTHIIKALVKAGKVEVSDELPTLAFSATGVTGDLTIVIPLPDELAGQEKMRLEKEKQRLIENLPKIEKLLGNSSFLERAKPELIESKKAELKRTQVELETINEKLSRL